MKILWISIAYSVLRLPIASPFLIGSPPAATWSSAQRQQTAPATKHFFSSSPYSWESSSPTEGDDSEETLMRIRLSIHPGISPQDALETVQRYTQSFPFAAVLPVQPLQYLPTHDGGVDVLFLRKKTAEKGSVDGGIRFFVLDKQNEDGIEVAAKRNSQGQVVSKVFSERQIIQTFVKGMSGQDELVGQGAPTEAVSIESVYHKWM